MLNEHNNHYTSIRNTLSSLALDWPEEHIALVQDLSPAIKQELQGIENLEDITCDYGSNDLTLPWYAEWTTSMGKSHPSQEDIENIIHWHDITEKILSYRLKQAYFLATRQRRLTPSENSLLQDSILHGIARSTSGLNVYETRAQKHMTQEDAQLMLSIHENESAIANVLQEHTDGATGNGNNHRPPHTSQPIIIDDLTTEQRINAESINQTLQEHVTDPGIRNYPQKPSHLK